MKVRQDHRAENPNGVERTFLHYSFERDLPNCPAPISYLPGICIGQSPCSVLVVQAVPFMVDAVCADMEDARFDFRSCVYIKQIAVLTLEMLIGRYRLCGGILNDLTLPTLE